MAYPRKVLSKPEGTVESEGLKGSKVLQKPMEPAKPAKSVGTNNNSMSKPAADMQSGNVGIGIFSKKGVGMSMTSAGRFLQHRKHTEGWRRWPVKGNWNIEGRDPKVRLQITIMCFALIS